MGVTAAPKSLSASVSSESEKPVASTTSPRQSTNKASTASTTAVSCLSKEAPARNSGLNCNCFHSSNLLMPRGSCSSSDQSGCHEPANSWFQTQFLQPFAQTTYREVVHTFGGHFWDIARKGKRFLWKNTLYPTWILRKKNRVNTGLSDFATLYRKSFWADNSSECSTIRYSEPLLVV